MRKRIVFGQHPERGNGVASTTCRTARKRKRRKRKEGERERERRTRTKGEEERSANNLELETRAGNFSNADAIPILDLKRDSNDIRGPPLEPIGRSNIVAKLVIPEPRTVCARIRFPTRVVDASTKSDRHRRGWKRDFLSDPEGRRCAIRLDIKIVVRFAPELLQRERPNGSIGGKN